MGSRMLETTTWKGFAALIACALTASCTAAYDGSEEAAGASAEAVTVPAWRDLPDYPGVDLDSVTIDMQSQGFRPTSISAWGGPSAPRFAAVFVQRSGPSFHLLHNTGTSTWQNAFSSEAAAGYKPALLSFDGDAS